MNQDRRLTWSLLAGGALVLALVLTAQMYLWINLWPLRLDWLTAFVWSLPQLLCWALVLPLIVWLADRWPIEGRAAAARLVLHAAASVACAVLVLGTLDVSDRLLHWSLLLAAPSKLLTAIDKTILHAHIGIAVYWVVLAVHQARRSYRRLGERELRSSQLETQLVEAQLMALRTQIDPHFLFNTLNAITVLLRHDPEAAERMLVALSDVLRNTLTPATVQEVPLDVEVAHLRALLDIEQVRFGERLHVRFAIDDAARTVAVPYMILQPLVENAIRHGIARRHGPGTIEISAAIAGGRVTLAVRDNGPGLQEDNAGRGFGIGLSNVTRRLAWLHGSEHRFDLRTHASGAGAEAIMSFPARPIASDGDAIPHAGPVHALPDR